MSSISHTRTVVRECCKDDCESLWKSLKFDPSPRKIGLTDRPPNLRQWLRPGYLPQCKILCRSDQGFFLPICVKYLTPKCSFFWFFSEATTEGPNWSSRKIRQNTRSHARMCLLGFENKIIFRPPFLRKTAIFGPILVGLRKFSAENRLTMGTLRSKLP